MLPTHPNLLALQHPLANCRVHSTSIAKGIDNLIGMSVVVIFPSLSKGASSLRAYSHVRNRLSDLQAIKHDHGRDSNILQYLQFSLEVGFQRERETSQGAKQGLFRGMLVKVFIEVVGRMDPDCRAFEGRKR